MSSNSSSIKSESINIKNIKKVSKRRKKFKREDLKFDSNSLKCAAWLYTPPKSKSNSKLPPIIIMAHGFGCEKSFRLPAYAEKFVEKLNVAVFVFDYRNLGESEGEPRGWVSPSRHCEDWQIAVNYIKNNLDKRVDINRIALWGTSFSGGHVLFTAAQMQLQEIKCVISQVPYVGESGVTLSKYQKYQAGKALIADKIASLWGGCVTVPVVGDSNSFALMMDESMVKDFYTIVPEDNTWPNAIPARILGEIGSYQPREHVSKIKCPVLIQVAKHDKITPANAAKQCCKQIAQGTLKEYDCGHMSVYTGDTFEQVVQDEIEFLRSNLI